MLSECVPCLVHVPFVLLSLITACVLSTYNLKNTSHMWWGIPGSPMWSSFCGGYLQRTINNAYRNTTCWVRCHPCPPWANGGTEGRKATWSTEVTLFTQPVDISLVEKLNGTTQPHCLYSCQMLWPQWLGGDILLDTHSEVGPWDGFLNGGIRKKGQASHLLHMQDWEGPGTFVRKHVGIAGHKCFVLSGNILWEGVHEDEIKILG